MCLGNLGRGVIQGCLGIRKLLLGVVYLGLAVVNRSLCVGLHGCQTPGGAPRGVLFHFGLVGGHQVTVLV